MALEKEKLLELYRKMLMVRAIEEKHAELLASGRVQLMSHFGTGQEAVSVGVSGCLRREDILFGTHRGVGEYIGKGMTPKDIWAEYLGKTNGPCKGKGTLHLASKTVNIPGLVSSLGSDFSIAVGTALASKLRKLDQATLYFVGNLQSGRFRTFSQYGLVIQPADRIRHMHQSVLRAFLHARTLQNKGCCTQSRRIWNRLRNRGRAGHRDDL